MKCPFPQSAVRKKNKESEIANISPKTCFPLLLISVINGGPSDLSPKIFTKALKSHPNTPKAI